MNPSVVSKSQQVLRALREARSKIETLEKRDREAIAIIGLSCRFPKANQPAAYWELLRHGVDAIEDIPSERWNVEAYSNPEADAARHMYVRRIGAIEQVDRFDPLFFGISRRQAEGMDPQQRLLLEVSWEALEHAGLAPTQLRRSSTGVFMGLSTNDYAWLNAWGSTPTDHHAVLGTVPSLAVGRISYMLGLHGPAVYVDTACSSSLVSVHLACQSLRHGESDLALAGGVNLILSPLSMLALCRLKALSPMGRCRTFDASADGYVRGEGCGVVVLKRLSEALQDKDHILAVIRGSAINHDGPSSNLTAPNEQAQEDLLRRALHHARLQPGDMQYIEAHGTGTALGDPIEIGALSSVYRERTRPLWIGSVKTNIGHLEAAAGIAGLLKVVLAIQHGEIPPHLHFHTPNPSIDWATSPVQIPTARMPWPHGKRIAGVSSFGLSGTNVHVIVEEPPVVEPVASHHERPWHVLTLSAKTEPALMHLAGRYHEVLSEPALTALPDLCYTANVGRSHFAHRLGLTAESVEQMRNRLAAFVAGRRPPGSRQGHVPDYQVDAACAFLFTGQGSQYAGMGYDLYATQPTFRQQLDRCDAILRPYLDTSLIAVLYPERARDASAEDERAPATDDLLRQTAYTQPALFALEYALAALWQSWGVVPRAVMGHSVGEYVAACVAGIFSLEEGLRLVAERGRLMQALPQDGEMVAVLAREAQVETAAAPHAQEVSIAAINGPENLVISGRREAVASVVARLQASGVTTRRLVVSHAFHSPLMDPIVADFERLARTVRYAAPRIPLVSNLTGALATEEIATPQYWMRHLRAPVRFAVGMQTLHAQGCDLFIEIGPQPTLLGMGRRCLPKDVGAWLPSLRQGQPDWQVMLESLTALYCHGTPIDWAGVDRDYPRRKVELPTYPFQRQRYWADIAAARPTHAFHGVSASETWHPLLGCRLRSALKDLVFESQVSPEAPSYLKHHRVFERVILPVTAYIEMALAAATAVLGTHAVVLEELLLEQPLMLPDDGAKTLQVILTPVENRAHTFQIFSLTNDATEAAAADWMRLATGKVCPAAGQTEPQAVNLAALQAEYPVEIPVERHYQQLQQRGLDYGPGFQALSRLWQRDGNVFGHIELPEELAGTSANYRLHPVLLDACSQMLGAVRLDDAAADIYLPVKIERITVYQNVGDQLWSQAQLRPVDGEACQTRVADLHLFDASGTVVAQVEGLCLRRAPRRTLLRLLHDDFDDWLYEITWRLQHRDAGPVNTPMAEPGNWLIFADASGLGSRLAQKLSARGEPCILVSAGAAYQQHATVRFQIDPANPVDFQRLMRAACGAGPVAWRGVVHLWGLDESDATCFSVSDLQRAQVLGCGSLLHLVQALAQTGTTTRVWLVTRGAMPVGPANGALSVAQASVWGLGRVVALEHPELWGGMVDLAPESSADDTEQLLAAIGQTDGEDHIALRHGHRYVARLRQNQAKAAREIPVGKDSSYLITGGLGALGLQVAQWFAAQGARHLVLSGRSGVVHASARDTIRHLEQAGVQVLVVQADVSKPEEVSQLLEKIATALPPLRGIVHAAGVLDDDVLLRQDWDRFKSVMAPKVAGAWNLHTLTQNLRLDMFVCFSSATALSGLPGQGSYAAANTFLDILAHHRRALGLPGLSINWGPWAEAGMTARLADRGQAYLMAQGVTPIAPEQGVQVFGELLGQDIAQVGVLRINWTMFRQHLPTGAPPALLSDLLHPIQQQDQGRLSTTQRREFLHQFEKATPEARQEMIVAYIREQVGHSLALPADQLDPQQPLNRMGFDSLMAIALRNRMKADLDLDVPIATFIADGSLITLAHHMREQLSQTNRHWQDSEKQEQQIIAKPIAAEDWVEGEL
ncbi:hypothetical protein NKDENANG_00344 [Candidatus Entotheonellaceae bacterium PAL068K]